MDRKMFTIVGATGKQGGSVAAVFLSNYSLSSRYKIRAVTRNPSSPEAQALASKGAEIVQADLHDVASLRAALKGSYAVFGNTNFWEMLTWEKEFPRGKNIVDASKAEGVKHLVWSTLGNIKNLTHGELPELHHCDVKDAVAVYAEKNKGDMIVSYFMPAHYMNTTRFLLAKLDPDKGVPTLSVPWSSSSWIPLLDEESLDAGMFVAGLIEAGDSADGVSVQGVSEWVQPEDMAKTISQVLGRETIFQDKEIAISPPVPPGVQLPDRITEELRQTFLLLRNWDYYGVGSWKNQAEHDKYYYASGKKSSFRQYAEKTMPWPGYDMVK
ncbi:hypothetical protein ACEPPN_019129 [Leptodophora sp. 'Broadleaf-Isolate-01']